MATTTFVNGATLSDAAWFNDVDAITYDVFNSATTAALARTAISAARTDGANTFTTGTQTFSGLGQFNLGLNVAGAAFTSRGITDNATSAALTLSGSSANSITIANSAGNPIIGTSAGSLQITPAGGSVNITGNLFASGYSHFMSLTATPAGGAPATGVFMGSSAIGVIFGSGAPTVSAVKGSLYLRTDGSATNNRAYINTDGATTWTAITTAA